MYPTTTYLPTFNGNDSNGNPILQNLEVFGDWLLAKIWAVIDKENPENVEPPDVLQVLPRRENIHMFLICKTSYLI